MSWYGLLDIIIEQQKWVAEDRARTPVACPNDGEPLLQGENGILYCPYDGYRPRSGMEEYGRV